MTEVFLPEFRPFPESVFDPVPVHCEIESPIFHDDHIELAQFHTFESPIDQLASSHFCEIELHEECDLELQLSDSILLPDSIMTLVSLPDFNLFPESTLDPVPIHNEIESPIFEDHVELDQLYLFEDPIDKLASSHFCNAPIPRIRGRHCNVYT